MHKHALESLMSICLHRHDAIEHAVIAGGQLSFMLCDQSLQGDLGQERVGMLQGK
jgi:hypothetical protein